VSAWSAPGVSVQRYSVAIAWGICLRGATRPSCAIGMAIFWNWFVYIHLNPVRAAMVKRPSEWQWSGHGEYLGKVKRGLIDCGPVMGESRTGARYEAFIREGAKVNYRAEWHPGDRAPFLGPERFVKKMAKETIPPPVSRRSSLKDLLKSVATKASQTVRRGSRAANRLKSGAGN